MKKTLLKYGVIATMLALTFSACSSNPSSNPAAADDTVYALLNIPYSEFFAEETTEGDFDAYTSATQKAANGSMSYGSYHTAETPSEAVAKGIICPVKISKALLTSLGGKEITDASDSIDIEITGKGASTIRYSGKQTLFQSSDYSYYILTDTPSYYKEVTKNGQNVSYGKIKGTSKEMGTLYVTLKAGEQNHEFSPTIALYVKDEENSSEEAIKVKALEEFEGAAVASTVTKNDDGTEELTDKTLSSVKTIIATDSDGKEYGLNTLSNYFWGKKQMGFPAPESNNYYPQHELVGKTITKLTFVTEADIYTATTFIKGTVDSNNIFTEAEDSTFVVEKIQAAAKQKN